MLCLILARLDSQRGIDSALTSLFVRKVMRGGGKRMIRGRGWRGSVGCVVCLKGLGWLAVVVGRNEWSGLWLRMFEKCFESPNSRDP